MKTTEPTILLNEARIQVQQRLDDLAIELEDTAHRIRNIASEIGEVTFGAVIAGADIGRALRQPFGQNSLELLFRDLADMAEYQGMVRSES
jgi:hypothetical protein